MEHIIGYQYSETGATGYYFYKDKKLLCKITTGLFFPVWIMGMGREWESNYDFNNTILPGVSRKIKDTESGETIAKITYVSAGRYRIGDLIDVAVESGNQNRILYGDDGFIFIAHCDFGRRLLFIIPEELDSRRSEFGVRVGLQFSDQCLSGHRAAGNKQ